MKVKNHEIKDYSSYILQFIYNDLSNKKKTILTNNELFDYYNLKKKSNNNNNYQIDKKLLYLDQDRFRLIRYNDKKTQFLLQITKNNLRGYIYLIKNFLVYRYFLIYIFYQN
jgi:hypothetical protein